MLWSSWKPPWPSKTPKRLTSHQPSADRDGTVRCASSMDSRQPWDFQKDFERLRKTSTQLEFKSILIHFYSFLPFFHFNFFMSSVPTCISAEDHANWPLEPSPPDSTSWSRRAKALQFFCVTGDRYSMSSFSKRIDEKLEITWKSIENPWNLRSKWRTKWWIQWRNRRNCLVQGLIVPPEAHSRSSPHLLLIKRLRREKRIKRN